MTADAAGTVLVVEDDADVRAAVTSGLESRGFRVDAVASAEAALGAIARTSHDLIVLDVGLPGMSGIELCAALRDRGIELPLLILSARDAVGDRVGGLQAGADDYLVKPFDLTELVARLDALLRRSRRSSRPVPTSTVRVGDLEIDLDRRTAQTADRRLDLTRREFDLLATLVSNTGIVMSRTRLLELVWGYDFDVETNVVDVFVGYLRKKMGDAGLPKMIVTVRGVGFVMEPVPS